MIKRRIIGNFVVLYRKNRYNIDKPIKSLMKKKAFTLIELMIVLAVIAILAVVLIPRAGASRTEARLAGVTTNVNSVRSFLEARTGARFINVATDLDKAIKTAFEEDELENPLDDSKDPYVVSSDTPDSPEPGRVVVIVKDNQYEVYGVDNAGRKMGKSVIIKK